MHQKLEYEDRDEGNKGQNPDKKGEIADVLKMQGEGMEKQAIDIVKRIAQYYYGTDKMRNYGKDVEENNNTPEESENGIHREYLYTIIKYKGKDTLVHIGTGEFTPEVFTRRDIAKLRGLSHSPLPLFVVAAWVDEEYKEQNPKKFLEEHTILYSPKGGQAELRISHKQREHTINYGKSNGIMHYEDAVLALKNAEIHKTFHSSNVFEKFIHKMKELKTYTPEKIHIRSNRNNREGEEEFYNMVHTCLLHLSDGEVNNLYPLIQSFDLHKRAFTHIHHF